MKKFFFNLIFVFCMLFIAVPSLATYQVIDENGNNVEFHIPTQEEFDKNIGNYNSNVTQSNDKSDYSEDLPETGEENLTDSNTSEDTIYNIIFILGLVSVLMLLIIFVNRKKIKSIIIKIPKQNYHILGYITFFYISYITLVSLENTIDYGYYEILRFLVTIFSGWTAYRIFIKDYQSKWLLVFGALTILFNPIVKITLEKDVWQIIDFITIIIILVYSIRSRNSSEVINKELK